MTIKDTHPLIQEILDKKYQQLSPEERVEMATSMFDCAREIVIQSIRNANPLITNESLRKEILLRFYGNELPIRT